MSSRSILVNYFINFNRVDRVRFMRLWLSGHLNTLVLIPIIFLLSIRSIDAYLALKQLTDSQYTIVLSELLGSSSLVVLDM